MLRWFSGQTVFPIIHKDADEDSGSMNDGKNCLTRFVADNAALVFWANCFLTTLKSALVMICYCGSSTLSIRNICQIAPINILCSMISCMMNCSKIECYKITCNLYVS